MTVFMFLTTKLNNTLCYIRFYRNSTTIYSKVMYILPRQFNQWIFYPHYRSIAIFLSKAIIFLSKLYKYLICGTIYRTAEGKVWTYTNVKFSKAIAVPEYGSETWGKKQCTFCIWQVQKGSRSADTIKIFMINLM